MATAAIDLDEGTSPELRALKLSLLAALDLELAQTFGHDDHGAGTGAATGATTGRKVEALLAAARIAVASTSELYDLNVDARRGTGRLPWLGLRNERRALVAVWEAVRRAGGTADVAAAAAADVAARCEAGWFSGAAPASLGLVSAEEPSDCGDADAAATAMFAEWVESEGEANCPISMAVFEGSGRGLTPVAGLPTLGGGGSVAAPTRVLSVPPSLLLHAGTFAAECGAALPTLSSIEGEAPHPELLSMLAALHERFVKAEASRWWPYWRLLPAKWANAVGWSGRMLGELDGSEIFEEVLDARTSLYETHCRLFPALSDALPELFPIAACTWENWQWVRGCFDTRAMHLDLSSLAVSSSVSEAVRPFCVADAACLVPLADMANHSPLSQISSASFKPAEMALVFEAMGGCSPGSELYLSYGALENSKLLAYYGFVYGSNPCERLLLNLWELFPEGGLMGDAEGPEGSGLGEARHAALEAMRLPFEHFLSAAPAALPSPLLSVARTGCASAEALAALSAKAARLAPGERQPVSAADVGAEAEARARAAISAALTAKLSSFPTTIAEDEAALRALGEEVRGPVAALLTYRLGQKRIAAHHAAARKRALLVFDFDNSMVDENTDTYCIEQLDRALYEEGRSVLRWGRGEGEGAPWWRRPKGEEVPWTALMDALFVELNDRGHNAHAVLESLASTPFPLKEPLKAALAAADLGWQDGDGGESEHSVEVIVISDANEHFIRSLLARHGLEDRVSRVYSNPSRVDDSGALRVAPFAIFYALLL